jgi:hypothetical protein
VLLERHQTVEQAARRSAAGRLAWSGALPGGSGHFERTSRVPTVPAREGRGRAGSRNNAAIDRLLVLARGHGLSASTRGQRHRLAALHIRYRSLQSWLDQRKASSGTLPGRRRSP